MEYLLRLGVILAFVLSLILMTMLILHTFTFRKSELQAASRGKTWRGIWYALGPGLLPWQKESASRHLISYLGGFIYHFGIFAGLLWLFFQAFALSWAGSAVWVVRIFLVAGLLAGLGLLIKRFLHPVMRSISHPDDFVANGLVDGFLAAALLSSFDPALRWIFWVISILLLLYIPLGKIRHCFFFFYSRILFGRFFGRRAVFPRSQDPFEVE